MKKIKRKLLKNKRDKIIESIKKSTPSIIFKAQNIVVTLRNKTQLKYWMDKYPEGTYVIN